MTILTLPKSKVNLPHGHRFFRDCLQESYARMIEWWLLKYISGDVWFITSTFKHEISERKAWLLYNEFMGRLNQAYEDTLGGGHRLSYISTQELQKRQVIHVHGLAGGTGLGFLSRKRWEARWENTVAGNCGFCRIYDAVREAAPYLSKYLNKDNPPRLGGSWKGLQCPASIQCCRPSNPGRAWITTPAGLYHRGMV